MGTNTYANNNEICSKSASGKSLAALPDPCYTPPPTPAGVEMPAPYPNTAMASDLDKGSAKVLICDKMVALEKDSFVKTSAGDEAAQPSSMQGGVVTHTTKDDAVFSSWSDDVKFEGKGVCRHLDITTHNHKGQPGHCVPMLHVISVDMPVACSNDMKEITSACGGSKKEVKNKKGNTTVISVSNITANCAGLDKLPKTANKQAILDSNSDITSKYADIFKYFTYKTNSAGAQAAAAMATTVTNSECLSALRCSLHKYEDTQNTEENEKKPFSCCKGQSGHHIIPVCVAPKIDCWPSKDAAPTICVEGVRQYHGTHGKIHDALEKAFAGGKKIDCKDIVEEYSNITADTFSCNKDCMKAQLEKVKKDCTNCEHKDEKVTAKSGKGGAIVTVDK